MSGPGIARALLVAHAPLIAVVPPNKVIVGDVAQGTTPPLIGITEVSYLEHKTVEGSRGGSTKATSLVQVTVVGATNVSCRDVMVLVRDALRDFVGNIGSFSAVTCSLEHSGPDATTAAGLCAKSHDARITFDT